MPIGSGIVYNTGDLILSQVSSSGTAFLETKIAAATSSLIYFDSTARINSASLNSITVGTASYVSGSTSIITNLTASNISASGTSSFGMVGIGTTVPGALLDVNGLFRFQQDIRVNNGTDKLILSATSTTTELHSAGTTGIVFKNAGNNEIVRFDAATGNVGIGTNTPGTLLEISSSTASSLLNVKGAGGNGILFVSGSGNVGIGTTSPLEAITFGASNSIIARSSATTFNSGYCSRILFNQGGTGYGYLGFYTYEGGSGGGERMRISENGNVGIGTTSPVAKLQVSGSISGSSFTSSVSNAVGFLGTSSWAQNVVSASFATTAQTANALNASNTYTVAGLTSAYVDVNGSSAPTTGIYRPSTKTLGLSADSTLIFKISNVSTTATSSIETGNFLVSGSVGIGTTSPIDKLDLNSGNIRLSDNYKLYNGSSNDSVGIYFSNTLQANIAGYSGIIFRSSATNISSQTERMRITSDGNVGIGTSSPAQKLEVQSGSVLIRGDGTALFGTYYASAGENTFFTLHSGSGNTFHIGNDVAGTNYNTMVFTAATDSTGGKVGIGTSSPGSKLQINDNTPVLTIRANDGGTSRKAYIDFYTTFFNYPSDVGARRTSTIVTGFDSGVWGTEFLAFNVGSGSANDAALLPIERVRIDGSGNLGVGTSTIIGKLQVNSTSAPYYGPATSSATANGIFILGNTTADVVNTFGVDATTTAYAWIQPRKTGTATYYSLALNPNGGNVGIGTTSPNDKLHVSGSITAGTNTSTFGTTILQGYYTAGSLTVLGTEQSSGGPVLGYAVTPSTSSTAAFLSSTTITIPRSAYTQDGGTHRWYIGASQTAAIGSSVSLSEVMRINSSGNIGIGTTVPTGRLNIASTSQTTKAIIQSVSAATGLGGYLAFNPGGDSTYSKVAIGVYDNYFSSFNRGNIAFMINSVADSSEVGFSDTKMYISASGNVGVGTTNPTSKLEIYANTAAASTPASTLTLSNALDGGHRILFKSSTGNLVAIDGDITSTGVGTDDGVFKVSTSVNGSLSERMRIDSSGNVGIGTTSPAYLLDVSGSSRHGYRTADNHYFTGSVNISGSLNATASWAQNVVSASYALTSSFATRAQTANALNALNTYSIAGLTSAYVDVDGSSAPTTGIYRPSTKTLGLSADSTLIFKISYVSAPATSSIETGNFLVSGSVGIGTTSVPTRLTTYVGSGAISGTNDAIRLQVASYNNAARNTIVWAQDSSNVVLARYGTEWNASTNQMNFVWRDMYNGGVGSTELMRFTGGGNLGIGTTVPNSKLEVAGTAGTGVVSIVNTTNGRSGSFGIDNSGVFIRNSSDGDYFDLKNASGVARFRVIYDNATHLTTNFVSIGNLSATGSKLSVFGNLSVGSTYGSTAAPSNGAIFQGSVGIGTTSPDSSLHVYSTSFEPTIRLTSTSGSVKTYGLVNNPYWATGSFHIYDFTTDNSRIHISSTGNIGLAVGSTTPANRLDVVGDLRVRAAGAAMILDTATTSDGRMEYKYNGTRKALIGVDSDNLQISADSGNFLQFRTNNTQRMIINNSGGVGIGTSSPLYLVDIYDTGANSAMMSLRSSGSGNARIYFDAANGDLVGSDYCYLGQDDSTLNFVINTSNAAGNIHLQPKDGTNNGILYVSGSTRFGRVISQTHEFTGSINLSGSLNATASWANNVVSASYATTAQTANALNTGNSYTIAGLTNNGTLSQQNTLSMGSGYQILATTGTVTNPGISFVGDTNTGIYSSGADTIGLVTGGSEKVTINSTGNVGIGTTSPTNGTLQVYNASGNTLSLQKAAGGAALAMGSDTTNYALIESINAGGIRFYTGNGTQTERLRIDVSGNVGIGTTNPVAKLQVAGNVSGSSFTSSISNAVGFLGTSSWAQNVVSASFATTAQTANALNVSNTYTIAGLTSAYVDVTGAGTIPTTGIYRPSTKTLGLSADGTLIFKISNVSAPATSSIETGNFLVQTGNVGIGTTNPTDKLTVYGALASYKTGADTIQTQVYLANGGNTRAFNIQLNSGGTGLDLWSYNSANAWLRHTTFDYDGRVGIGTAAPVAKFEISGSSNSALMNIKSPISGAILYVSGSGAVGIGTSNVGAFTLQVNGSFGATTKSFIIDHPTKAGKKLMYGSLESPYHGIRLTGRDTLVNGKCKIQLPDYMYKLILHDSVNIQLTGIKCNKTLYVDEINIPENYFTIAYDKAIFESYKDYDFFWDFTAIRSDVPELITEL
jgi:hypothetical protein